MWLAEQDAAGHGDRATAQMLGCDHRTVGRGRPRDGRNALTRGLVRYIDDFIEATGWRVEGEDAGEGSGALVGVCANRVSKENEGNDEEVEAGAGAMAEVADEGNAVPEGDSGPQTALAVDDEGALRELRDGRVDIETAASDAGTSAPTGEQGIIAADQTCEQPNSGSPQGTEADEGGGDDDGDGNKVENEGDTPAQAVVELPVVPKRALTEADVVRDWAKDANPQETTIRREERRKQRLIREFQQNLVRSIAEARTVTELAALTAQARREALAKLYPRDAVYQDDEATPDAHPQLASFKCQALAVLMETPVLAVLPVDVAIGAALTMVRREVTMLDLPQGVHGDAAPLLLNREPANYLDEGARAVGFAAADAVFEDGLTTDELRAVVPRELRMKRYAHETHGDRPVRIGQRLADVIQDKRYRDEDWRFGSPGWTDEEGYWQPGRAELIARWRLARALYDDWNALERNNRWHYALYEARAELELMLLHPLYGMTFDRLITGVGQWPRSTRLGFETEGRFLQVKANQGYAGAMRRRRVRRLVSRRTFSWIGRWVPALIFALRRDFAVYIEKENRPKGKERRQELKTLWLRYRLYDKHDPSAKLPRLRETVLPSLYEPVSEQRWFTRRVSWLLYRRHSELDGSVSGAQEWVALDPPLTPDYMTPNPRTGYIPSEAFRRRFRPHEYAPGYVPQERPGEVGILRRLGSRLRAIGKGVGRGVGRVGAVVALPYRGGRRVWRWAFRRGREAQGARPTETEAEMAE